MSFISFIKRNVIPKKDFIIPKEFKNEDEYYTFFFTQHPKWSKPNPNKAEQERLQIIEQLIQQVQFKKSIDIIDFGCGRGWLTNQLSKYGNVKGIEPVANVVEYAEKLFPNQDFIAGSFDAMKNLKADLIVSSEVIEHIANNEKTLFFQTFYHSLNTNGYCIITTPRAEVQQEWMKYRNDNGQPVEDWLTEIEVERLAISNGFNTISKNILQEKANGPETPLLDLYQIWLFQKNEH